MESQPQQQPSASQLPTHNLSTSPPAPTTTHTSHTLHTLLAATDQLCSVLQEQLLMGPSTVEVVRSGQKRSEPIARDALGLGLIYRY